MRNDAATPQTTTADISQGFSAGQQAATPPPCSHPTSQRTAGDRQLQHWQSSRDMRVSHALCLVARKQPAAVCLARPSGLLLLNRCTRQHQNTIQQHHERGCSPKKGLGCSGGTREQQPCHSWCACRCGDSGSLTNHFTHTGPKHACLPVCDEDAASRS